MFLHAFKYSIKRMLRNKTSIIWTLIFPIALGTFMYVAFGNIYQKDEIFKEIPVGIVREQENVILRFFIDQPKTSSGSKFLDYKYMKEEDATEALKNGEIKAIIYMGEDVRMMTYENNTFETTIVAEILNQYKKLEYQILDAYKEHPEVLDFIYGRINIFDINKNAEAISSFLGNSDSLSLELETPSFYKEKAPSDANQDPYVNYFYAVLAMSCMFASFAVSDLVCDLQPNLSSLGMRRSITKLSKASVAFAEFLAMLIFQFIVEIIAFFYLKGIGVKFIDKTPAIILILLVGSAFGLSLGIIIGSIPKLSRGAKSGLCISISMVMSVMADLCVNGIKNLIEHSIPILNRINPAVLIVDSFYGLSVYDDYGRYIRNMTLLGIITGVALIISFSLLRRCKNASL